jgi:nucleoside-diphosphate-sugar epimerase
MRILLTGGTGFIGTALRRALKEEGHDVRLLVRTQSAGKIDPREGYEVIAGDALDTQTCMRAVEACDAIVHLIGIRREFPHDGITYEALHTEATYAVVDAAVRNKVPRIIYMSSQGARPDAPSRYHKTKWESEEIVRNSGMRWTIFRPSIIFGEGDEFHPLMAELVHRNLVPIIDGGKSLLQPVALHNVIPAMARSLVMPETQGKEIEVGGPERVKFLDIMYAVARHYGVWPNTFPLSSLIGKPLVKALQGTPNFPLTYDELLLLLEDNVCDNTEFLRLFGGTLDTYQDKIPSLCPHIYELADKPAVHHG